jgi:6-phosphogluconolactonase
MIKLDTASVEVKSDSQAVALYVANWLKDLALQAKDKFSIVLSGGSTPKVLYSLMAQAPYCDQFPWHKVHWFFGDERFVPQTDELSNYKMVRDAMLSKVKIPDANIHPVKTDLKDAKAAALDYELELKRYYGADKLDPNRPLFDVVLLGLGEDGHTASLFPGTAVLKEREAWVSAVIGAKPEARITMTYPVLESSHHVAFIVTGAGKQKILADLFGGDKNLPSANVKPSGQLHWFLDQDAARLVNDGG